MVALDGGQDDLALLFSRWVLPIEFSESAEVVRTPSMRMHLANREVCVGAVANLAAFAQLVCVCRSMADGRRIIVMATQARLSSSAHGIDRASRILNRQQIGRNG